MAGFKQRKTPYGFYNHGGLHFDQRAWQMWQDVPSHYKSKQAAWQKLVNSGQQVQTPMWQSQLAQGNRPSVNMPTSAWEKLMRGAGMQAQTPMTQALVPYNPPGGLAPSNRFPVPLTGGPVGPYAGGGGPLAPYGGGGGGGSVVPPKGPPLA